MERLRTLQARNQTTPRRHEVVASATEATIYLYDFVGSDGWGGGVDARQFVQELGALTAPTVHLRINSPGGDVFDGRAMATAIRQHGAKVVAHIDGLAASAASFIALAADEVEIVPGAMVMIHRASAIVWGTASDMLDMAEVLDKLDGALIAEYVRETGNDEAQVTEWVDAEKWFTAEEALEHGFADRLAEDAVKADNRWDLSAYGIGGVVRAAADEFKVGDRVRVKDGAEHDEMTKGSEGEVVEISSAALGIQFDDMDGVHKWYVSAELEAADDDSNGDGQNKKKKHEMAHQNANDQAERERRFRLIEHRIA